MYVDSNI